MISPKGILLSAALVGGFLLALIGLTSKARGHDIYTDWRNPTNGVSCCNATDCYPTAARFEHGQWFALRREDQRWLAIPPENVLKDGSTPDGEAHLCAPAPLAENDTRVFCFRPPFMGG